MGGPRSIICITMDCNWLQCRYIHVQNVSNDFHSFTHSLRSVSPPFRAINDRKTSIFPKLKVKDLDLNRFFLIIMVTQTSLNINHTNHLFALFKSANILGNMHQKSTILSKWVIKIHRLIFYLIVIHYK